MSILGDSLAKSLKQVTKDFTKVKQQSFSRGGRGRGGGLTERDYICLRNARKRKEKAEEEATIKDAAWQVMEQAYLMASDNGTLPANARQVMYAARPLVLEITAGKVWGKSEYFTQHMLPDYIEQHPSQTAKWDVVFDARGHFQEPHTDLQLALGTLEVRSYIASWTTARNNTVEQICIDSEWPTSGPANRYKFALFVEKEGFNALIERSQIRSRYDIALFSTKGMSVTSARQLVEALSIKGVTILVMHDFDLAGITICYTLGHNTRRFKFKVNPNIIDLGLRLKDVEQIGLQSEPVLIQQRKDPRERFEYSDYDVTKEELNFLIDGHDRAKHIRERGLEGGTSVVAWPGKRVELNAMTSRQLIDWLERKFQEIGVHKVLPDEETLAAAWQRACRIAVANDAISKLIDEANKDSFEPPADLMDRMRQQLYDSPTQSWDSVLADIADQSANGSESTEEDPNE
jgi:hypothetical protein